ncbi:hypothetical protein KIS4809_1596 [Bacillus sp. ZZV12-4809]|nr:hypothetical protein KIS4809_1596 [Bacillus sp. ZZV12-4809]
MYEVRVRFTKTNEYVEDMFNYRKLKASFSGACTININ